LAGFTYEALTQEGTVTRGSADAVGEPELERQLRQRGLYLIRASTGDAAEPGVIPAPARKRSDGRARHVDLLAFTEYLYGSSQAGIPLVTTLGDLETQLESKLLRAVTAEVRHAMATEGSTLSEALAEHPRIFSRLYVATVEAGETTGQLDYALGQLVDYLEWQREITLQIRQATLYPVIVLCVMFLLVAVLVTFVYPRLLPIFTGFGIDLPLPTRMVMGFGDFAQRQWLWVLIGSMGMFAGWRIAAATERGRLYIDNIKLRVPVFGPLFHQLEMARVVTYMGLFYRTGVDLLRGMDLLEQMIGNRRIARAIAAARVDVAGGESIAGAFAVTGLFPQIVIRSFALGETTGRLDESLERARGFYAREVPAAVRRMLGVLQPLLIVVLGGILAIVALSIFLPLVGIYQSIGR
jgi:type II secretory pathway component PulF